MTLNESRLKQNDPKTRDQIREYFKNGMLPSENDFNDLIDSMVNIKDDGFSKDRNDGLKIYATEDNKRFFTLYTRHGADSYLKMEHDDIGGEKSLKIQGGDVGKFDSSDAGKSKYGNLDKEHEEIPENKNAFFLHVDGKLGIGKKSDNNLTLDVNGIAGMQGRIGTYKNGRVKADKLWYKILGPLDRCQAFEIVARTGRSGSGKFAMIHAIAISTYGNSRNKIKKTSAYYGPFWNKINLRWTGNTNAYYLEMRTNANYTDKRGDVDIFYSVTSLWDEDLMVPAEYFEKEEKKQIRVKKD